MEYKSFMAEGYSIGAHAESLYGRGYKHYGTMGQGTKQVHIFTPAKGKVDHHMLLKHDGADPVRHSGAPDLKAIKTMTEAVDVQAIQKERATKAQRKDKNIQTHNVKEDLPKNAKAGDYVDDFVHSKNKMFSGDSKKQRIKRALGAYYGQKNEDKKGLTVAVPVEVGGKRYSAVNDQVYVHSAVTKHFHGWNPTSTKVRRKLKQGTPLHDKIHAALTDHVKKRDADLEQWYKDNPHAQRHTIGEDLIQEGWFTRSHPRIGNRSGSTHRVTVQHTKTGQKSTFDVTAPTNEHAVKHVINHLRTHPSVLKVTQIKHLYEEYEDTNKDSPKMIKSMKEWMELQEVSADLKNRYLDKAVDHQKKAFRKPADSKNLTPKGRLKKSWTDSDEYKNGQKKFEKRRSIIQKVSKEVRGKKHYSDMGVNEDNLSETTDPRDNLPIRYAINHPDSQVRHHAREYKKASMAYNAGHAKLASQHRSPTREQEDELINHYEVAVHHHNKYKNRLQQINPKSPFHIKKEDLDEAANNEKPHPKGTRVVVSHKGHQKSGRVIRHDPGGPDSSPFYIVDVGEYGSGKFMAHHVRKEDLDEAKRTRRVTDRHGKKCERCGKGTYQVADVNDDIHGERHCNKCNHFVHRYPENDIENRNEDLSEGGFMLTAAHKVATRVKNAVKNTNKKLKPTAVRIAQTREKVGYDNAKGKDLSARGNALRKVEKIEWSKQNPVKKKKDIVPMGKLPAKVWDEELEIRRGQKLLKEKPKKGADGKLMKSKAAQRVEDCIKMSGKKQKIDTEPSYNPLTTAGGGGGTPNA